MKDEIITYREMCDRENVQTLQRGMNFRLNADYSVILMSQRSNAPYIDRIHPDGITIEYEGHDEARGEDSTDPKSVNQPKVTRSGRLTQNGLFADAVEKFKAGERLPELVKVYEKVFSGVWSEKGFFYLKDYRYQKVGRRKVFRFILEEADIEIGKAGEKTAQLRERTRVIPSGVKKAVWARDKGRCVLCGSTEELHFDHDLPFSKGGTSITEENVRILCARCNLKKSNKIE